MNGIDTDDSVPNLVAEHPLLLRLFEELGIEYTCGGKSLRVACLDRGLNLAEITRLCEERLRSSTGESVGT